MKIDTLQEPPMFQITPTHFARTWLLDPRAPKVEKPEIIQNIHEKMLASLHISGGEPLEQ
jgi:oligopeptide transport system ATP-binding protein